ncbi:DUF429 domain-containing protein [Parafrankia discariae]|uniref:DUF429 domain-containing protein n=1 Tax=Parafrankia discariae TaxID=365528 RepID=UPI0012B68100|nr:DUF429 domain-containing protein [Parafrankia discariae]
MPVTGPRMRVLGVDACPGGWVAVELSGGAFAGARFTATLRDLTDRTDRSTAASASRAFDMIAVDMPLGLLADGWRECDRAARAAAGPRRASVFLVPPRPVWAVEQFADANALCRAMTGGGLTRQAWGLRPKVLEADALRADHPDALREVHPELAFGAMAGAPLPFAKTTWAGAAHRRALLAAAGIALPDDLGPANAVPPVDVLDAAAAAWTAHRIATGAAGCLPAPGSGQLDDRGVPTGIWF